MRGQGPPLERARRWLRRIESGQDRAPAEVYDLVYDLARAITPIRDARPPSPRRVHNFTAYLGAGQTALRGRDYQCSTSTFVTAARRWAKARDAKVVTRTTPDGVWLLIYRED